MVKQKIYIKLYGTYAFMLPQKNLTFPSFSEPITERIGIFRKEI